MGWCYYLEDRLDFPFEAEWFMADQLKSKIVQVIGMADEEDYYWFIGSSPRSKK